MSSPRRVLVTAMLDAWKEVRSKQYTVRRGAVNWSSHNFDKYPRVVSVMLDETGLGRGPDGDDFDVAVASFTCLAAIPDSPELDDGVLDEFYEDIEFVLRTVTNGLDSRGDAIGVAIAWNDIRVIELQDLELGVHGVQAIIPGIRY